MSSVKFSVIFIFHIVFTFSLISADWPCWRGPDRDGIAKNETLNPDSLKSVKVLWRAELGAGYSAVSTKNGKVYTAGNKSNSDFIYCFSEADGKLLWKYSYPCGSGGGYPGTRATPICHDGLVLMFSREGDLVCVDADSGALKWKRNLQKELDARNIQWGFSSSVLVVNGIAIVNAGISGMAFDLKTGKNAWKNKGGAGSYATPVSFSSSDKEVIAIFSEKTLYLLDAKNGVENTSFRWETKYDVNAADPLLLDNGEKIFLSSGYGTGCAMLKFNGKRLSQIWNNKNMSSHFFSPVFLEGHIYGVDGNAGGGNLVCIDSASGSLKWKGKTGFGAFVISDKTIIYINENGELVLSAASPDSYNEILKTRSGLQAKCWTMPVLSNSKLYLRNDKGTLLCIKAD